MNGYFDIYTIIFLVIAVVIFIKLRSVLGRRTGNERPPFDPYAGREEARPQNGDKVITLPRRDGRSPAGNDNAISGEEMADVLEDIAPRGSKLEAALKKLLSADRGFDPRHFLQGAKSAYEMIVTAFASGDRKTLKPLLASDVFEGFATAIDDRNSRGETIEFTFVGLDKAEITETEMRDTDVQISVRFLSQLISATRDKNGEIVDGDPNKVSEVTDIWTFARNIASRDPNWKLIATESPE